MISTEMRFAVTRQDFESVADAETADVTNVMKKIAVDHDDIDS